MIYDIYRPCINSTSSRRTFNFGIDPESIPCVDSYGIDQYFNNDTVREMFHVNNPEVGAWGVCTTAVNYTIGYDKGSIYTYPTLI
mmetsp:Transcript_22155/g.3677  ORF Transcript_22155/g.3677 Transcript_22155/m.3677 type:complete len:85 (-) Transcript_22155:302-556(-)